MTLWLPIVDIHWFPFPVGIKPSVLNWAYKRIVHDPVALCLASPMSKTSYFVSQYYQPGGKSSAPCLCSGSCAHPSLTKVWKWVGVFFPSYLERSVSDNYYTTNNCIWLLLYADFLGGSAVKNPPAMQETRVLSLGQEDPLEKEIATHSSILAWEIPWTEEPGRLQSMGSQVSDTTLATEHTHTPSPLLYAATENFLYSFLKNIYLFIHLFIFSYSGSSLLCAGFL